MTTVAELRAKFPQYEGVSDGDFLMGIHRKYYQNRHPREFLSAIEGAANAHVTIQNPVLKEYWRERVSAPMSEETERGTRERLSGSASGDVNTGGRVGQVARSALQGMTFGYGDEIIAAGTSALSGNSYNYELQRERDRLQAGEEQHPVQSFISEVGGSLLAPGAAVRSLKQAVGLGTAGGMVYASGKAEDGGRVEAAGEAFVPSLLFSIGGEAAQRGGSKVLRKLFGRTNERPTTGVLRATKNRAYKEVEQSGVNFSANELDGVLTRVYQRLDDPSVNYAKGDTQTEGALRFLEKNWGRDMTLGELDNVRSRLWRRWSSADDAQRSAILEIIGEVDDLIDTKPDATGLLSAAREADKAFRRTEILENMFQKAANQTATAGSGGNVYNNYGRVFQKILDNDRLSRRFTPEQLKFFEEAIKTPRSENVLRKLGKLSPDGNGLMLAMNVIGGMLDPSLLAVGGAGAVAKANVDSRAAQRASDALRLTSGVAPRPSVSTPSQVPYAAAVAGQNNGWNF